MHPQDCPAFEYEQLSGRSSILQRAVESLLLALSSGELDPAQLATDSRPAHSRLFKSLTTHPWEYFAGHYRGEAFRCLQYYEVVVHGDPRVGTPAREVANAMAALGDGMRKVLTALDQQKVPAALRLRYVVRFACTAFVEFLGIHPYANGNGHAGRVILWCILVRYGYWPLRWSIEPRPSDPPYTEAIMLFRAGVTEPLERFVLATLVSASQ